MCGGRDYSDACVLDSYLDRLHAAHRLSRLIHGGARGADSLAGRWAESRHVPVEVYLAEWARHGRAAGPIRNERMLREGKPDLVVAFPGGAGTAHMVRLARKSLVPVVVVG